MPVIIDEERCSGCTACVNACPMKCISMVENEDGFLYPIIDEEKCIGCNLCVRCCGISSSDQPRMEPISTLAAVNKNYNERMRSSSGGVFSLLAKQVLSENGVVYGAAMSEDCRTVNHIRIDNLKKLHRILGSKYLQSELGEIFKQVKKDLLDGLSVLFSGTPCQINGLVLFLGEEYQNLYTVDVVCHGVPSKLLWQQYLDYHEKKQHSKVLDVSFRYKTESWRKFGLKRIDDKWKEVVIPSGDDLFMRFFLNNYCLRESCYRCSAKTFRLADISLGDFWGIEQVAPEMDDNHGTSLVLIRTDKGNSIFQKIKNETECSFVKYEEGVRENYPEYKSVNRPTQRDVFFEELRTMSFEDLQKMYFPPKKISIKSKVRRGIGKVYRYFMGGG